ncbi:MAG TPA: UbiA family prenyltransferase, partial [Chloroflexota bacterium]|nr:UbiA family prenyltransferase [Chloroflexota bacterium]
MNAEAALARTAPARQGSALAGLWTSARPRQWTKNLILFGPLVFAYKLGSADLLGRAVEAFFVFCLASSAIYLINDVLDAESDRQHPEKRFRPVASGRLAVSQAVACAVVLALIGLALAATVNMSLVFVSAGYLALMLTYSTVLKHVVILDVFAIAGGFILRAVAGALAIHVNISPWLYVCTLLLALFLGFSKRYNELLVLQDGASSHRRNLDDYT